MLVKSSCVALKGDRWCPGGDEEGGSDPTGTRAKTGISASSLESLCASSQSTQLPVITPANTPHRQRAKSILTCNFYSALSLLLFPIRGQIKTRLADQSKHAGLQIDFSETAVGFKSLHFSR